MKKIKAFGTNLLPGSLRISLCDTNEDLIRCWQAAFAPIDGVEILHGDLLDASCDAIVSPANSFGDMGGGVDKHIDDFFGGAAQSAVQKAIRDQFWGELPVGMAMVLPLPPKNAIRFLVSAPTMRVPRSVQSSLNAYLSFRAALVAVLRYNRSNTTTIKTLAVPGLCTGVGGMDYLTSTAQMLSAYDNVLGGRWERIVHPAMAPWADH